MPETAAENGATIDLESWVCPAPLRDAPNIVMGHGGGGAMSAELIEHLFLPAFGSAAEAGMGDSAVIEVGGVRLAFSTDSFVVKPLTFPGGTIGDLAVNGTINDLAMAGAQPLALSTAFILEEGTALQEIAHVAHAVGTAALAAGVKLVTGDTKVVDSGHGDGVFINTAGIGVVDPRVDIRPQRAARGDTVIVSGDIGVHGVAVMSCREGLTFATTVASDTAPLHGLVAAMIDTGTDLHVLRDPTRGGVAATLNEIAKAAQVGVALDERTFPIPAEVRDACGLLGLDPLQVANEGKLLAFVPADDADRVLAAMRSHPLGTRAAVIGHCVAEHPGMVVARTALGGTRVVDLPIGEQLPRIC
ncbi:hydrogenase expression/formation protein HypE [Mycobacterium sp. CBMA293]|uniref:hydrogenase expression/formation protein HypE n=1 Tax=unclassified Mycolicibacterium TaxID=2636767 RepID=UPI0012DC49DA|nr:MULTISPECIES: hydrogenase expression/formation protein HypE [unclassified Mycolicibacterium]MUL48160.1 hydrogenase expression/formation protein HypE [Mycolicibacterium sp. CBMA 360]MUL57671.1 hydrogenase expression/formation protein HypE [Mycolicibacterium sp. CBMA 335]MUL70711.1 hydrogenase expression/formation protein HypE [Mycolicibacterium sp. CBMA 311]MUL92759.1 hydrogenase expression/formation protein HypE [Mycolicibacterium sp. CBMA 230]MUM08225.1 hydrogenase expression/formation pro